jgi:hypothetical protein
MPIHEAERGLGAAAGEIAAHAKSIARLEAKLAIAEVKGKLTAFGIGVGFALGAALFVVFAMGFALATVAAAIATTISTWLALLIVTGLCVGLAGVLAALGLRALRRGTPPVPRQAIENAKRTAQMVMKNGNGRST